MARTDSANLDSILEVLRIQGSAICYHRQAVTSFMNKYQEWKACQMWEMEILWGQVQQLTSQLLLITDSHERPAAAWAADSPAGSLSQVQRGIVLDHWSSSPGTQVPAIDSWPFPSKCYMMVDIFNHLTRRAGSSPSDEGGLSQSTILRWTQEVLRSHHPWEGSCEKTRH